MTACLTGTPQPIDNSLSHDSLYIVQLLVSFRVGRQATIEQSLLQSLYTLYYNLKFHLQLPQLPCDSGGLYCMFGSKTDLELARCHAVLRAL